MKKVKAPITKAYKDIYNLKIVENIDEFIGNLDYMCNKYYNKCEKQVVI